MHHRFIRLLTGLALLIASLAPNLSSVNAAGSSTAPIDPNLSLLRDINPGAGDSLRWGYAAQGAVALGSRVFFFANDGVHGLEPWITDGTTAGTRMIADTFPYGDGVYLLNGTPAQPVAWNGRVFYAGMGYSPYNTLVPQLWVSDGTEAGTYAVTGDFHPAVDFKAGPTGVMFRERVVGERTSIWWTDGTPQRTVLAYDWQGVDSSVSYQEYQGEAFIIDPNEKIWKFNPYTLKLEQMNSTPAAALMNAELLGESNGLLFLTKRNGYYRDRYLLWQTDGTAEGFTQVQAQDAGAFVSPYLAAPGALFFTSEIWSSADNMYLHNLYATSGAAYGITQLTSGTPQMNSRLTLAGGVVMFFRGGPGGIGPSLPWRSDGSPAGTWPMCTTCLHEPVYDSFFAPTASGILYTARDGMGAELWVTDGSDDGTHRLADLYPGLNGSDPTSILAVGDYVFFTANDGAHGIEPWVYRPRPNRLVTHHDSAVVFQNSAASIPVLSNDAQLDGLPFQLLDVDSTSLKGGAITRDSVNPDRVYYTPPNGYTGPDEFAYTITDTGSSSAAAGAVTGGRVSLSVVPDPVNDPPSMTPPPDLVLPKQAASYHRPLYGISAGPGETAVVTITASASSAAAVTGLSVQYTSGATGWLNFTFHPEVAPIATITLTLSDGVNQAKYTFTLRAAEVRPVRLPYVGK